MTLTYGGRVIYNVVIKTVIVLLISNFSGKLVSKLILKRIETRKINVNPVAKVGFILGSGVLTLYVMRQPHSFLATIVLFV